LYQGRTKTNNSKLAITITTGTLKATQKAHGANFQPDSKTKIEL